MEKFPGLLGFLWFWVLWYQTLLSLSAATKKMLFGEDPDFIAYMRNVLAQYQQAAA